MFHHWNSSPIFISYPSFAPYAAKSVFWWADDSKQNGVRSLTDSRVYSLEDIVFADFTIHHIFMLRIMILRYIYIGTN